MITCTVLKATANASYWGPHSKLIHRHRFPTRKPVGHSFAVLRMQTNMNSVPFSFSSENSSENSIQK